MNSVFNMIRWGSMSVAAAGIAVSSAMTLSEIQAQTAAAPIQEAAQDEPLPVKTVKLGNRDVRLFVNSEIVSDVTRINQSGGVVGTCEVTDKSGFVTTTETFALHADKYRMLKPAKSYTNVSAEQIDDQGSVVGFVSRPITANGRSIAAAIWNATSDTPQLLPVPEGSSGSQAHDICADGSIVTGYASGSLPPHLRPCVWTKSGASGNTDSDDAAWSVQFLDTPILLNQYTMSSTVRISPNGKRIVTCCTTKVIDGEVDSSLYSWEQDGDGQWKRTLLSDEQIYIKDINNAGQIVGSILAGESHVPIYVSETGQITRIPLLPGTIKGTAWGINESGLVVGINDEPEGPDGGPHAFQWNSRSEAPKTEKVPLGGAVYSTATSINEQGQIAGMAVVMLPAEANGQLPTEHTLGYITLPEQAAPDAQ